MNDKGVKTTICLFWLNLPLSSLFPFPHTLYPYTLLTSTKNIYFYKYIYYIFLFMLLFLFEIG